MIKRYSSDREAARERAALKACRRSPHIVRILDFFRWDGHSYIVMERILGSTLTERLETSGPLNAQDVAKLALSVLRGLHALHSQGFVHGDLHSDNVMVVDGGAWRTKIIDLQHAVAKDAKGRARAIRKLAHPPAKLAPESRTGVITDAYDIYGVGFMCAAALDRRNPRAAPLLKFFETAMHPDSTMRFPSTKAMIAAVKGAL